MPPSNTPKLPKKMNWKIWGAGGLIVVGGVIYFRNKASKQAQSSSTTGQQTDPAGNVGQIDPATGYVYGSTQDVQMQQGGLGYGYGAYGQGYGAIDPATGIPYAYESSYGGVGGSATGGTTNPNQITNNNQWMTAAEAALPNGTSSTVVNALLGVLGGLTVTTAQKNLFLEAVGAIGQPPGGYPQPIKTSDTPGQPNPVGLHTVTATGSQTLAQIASANGVSYGLVAALNPALASKYMGKDVPKGTKVKV